MREQEALLQLQEADLVILRAKKRFESLPEREAIAQARAKIHEALVKTGQINDLRDDCEKSITKLSEEDKVLQDRIREADEKLRQTTDHRIIAGYTKNREGAIRRREKIEFDSSELLKRLEKIEGMQDQVRSALERLESQEAALKTSFERQGNEIKEQVEQAQARRKEALADITPELLDRYTTMRKAKGGIGASVYEDGHCSVCNVRLQEGERRRIASGPPVQTCPSCGRLMVVDVERFEQ